MHLAVDFEVLEPGSEKVEPNLSGRDREPVFSERAFPGRILRTGLSIAGINALVFLAFALFFTFELQNLKWSLQGAAGLTSFATFYSIPSVAGGWFSGWIASALARRRGRAANLIATGIGAGLGGMVAWSGYLTIRAISPLGKMGAGEIQFFAQPFVLTIIWFAALFAWLGHRLARQAAAAPLSHKITEQRNLWNRLPALGTMGIGAVLCAALVFSVLLGAPLARRVELAAGSSPELRRYCLEADTIWIARTQIQGSSFIGLVVPLPSLQWEVDCWPWNASDQPIIRVDLQSCEATVITFSDTATYTLNNCP